MVEKVDKFDKFIKFDKFDEFEKFEEFEKLSSSEVLYEVEAKSFTTLQFLNFSWGIYPKCLSVYHKKLEKTALTIFLKLCMHLDID